ncbi:unnamed protein product [Ectocarpus sp. 6 AP-2014]
MATAATRACAALFGLSLASQTQGFTGGVVRPRTTTTTTTTTASLSSRRALSQSSDPVPSLQQASAWVTGRRQGVAGRRVAALRMAETAEATEEAAVEDGEERFEFQAEVGRVMDIIINSLYSNRDVFLRELISNSADACDKKRFLAVTDSGADEGGSDDDPEYRIRVRADKDAKTLIIEDSGVGMTKDELKNNLGRIAESGTANFMEAIKSGETDVSLIGQFGVGFYSAFLVADKVTVYTRSCQTPDAPQYKWESKQSNSYSIKEDQTDQLEGSGTRIVLHLKEDSEEYLDDFKIKELSTRYSEFISFPIEVWAEKTSYDQVPDTSVEVAEGEEPKMKTVTRTAMQWERMNKMKPIWMRSPREVKEEEYSEFYKSTFKAWDEVAAHTHFSLEGQVEFRALLFVPSVLPYELSRNMFDETSRNMRLYVKRVFINDKFEELLPRWLMFLRGVVDSEDLPLNVGREILQRSKMLSVISKRLVRKSLDMFKKLADDKEKYKVFWENFGKYLKVGVVEDEDIKSELAPLCRFFSKNHGEDFVSFDEYIADMKEDQKAIYYVTADSRASAQMSPALEKATSLGYDVLFMTEPLDELTVQSIGEYGGKPLTDLGKENVEFSGDEEEKAKKEEQSTDTQDFRQWLQELLGEKRVQKVEVSNRLVGSAATLVQSSYGMSPTMARYMKAQAVAFGEQDSTMTGQQQAIMEINPEHPVVKSLQASFTTDPDAASTKQTAVLLYDIAALTGGYSIDDPNAFAQRVTGMLEDRIGAPDASGAEGEEEGGVADAEVVG